uniref:phage tail fiber protein n=1 Tax=Providencia sp. PROV206 TaxID=2949904 RepID=UPI002349899C
MYSTGTVTTTANSTKLVGTGTKWLNNINRVSAEQAIQIQIGTTVHNNSIQSIQSDTELTLNFPLPTSATGAKYVILTTMVHSVSDAMNKIVSMNGANVQLSDILMRWMTEQGIITVTLPDQTTQQLRTPKEMDNQLDGKFDKAGGDVVGAINVGGNITSRGNVVQINNEKTGGAVQLDTGISGTTRINSKRNNGTWKNHILPDSSGTLMLVGDYGFGADKEARLGKDYRNCFVSYSDAAAANQDGWPSNGAGLQSNYASNRRAQIFINGAGVLYHRWSNVAGADNSPWKVTVSSGEELAQSTSDMESHFKGSYSVSKIFRNTANTSVYSNVWAPIFFMKVGNSWNSISIGNTDGSFKVGYGDSTTTNSMLVYTTRNTTKDSNGNLKAASPIVKLLTDDIELNEESEGVEMEH